MAHQLDNPFYYLDNFEFVLNWVDQRYADVLNCEEAAFIQQYRGLPKASRSLLVRMVMRRGVVFRHSRLRYTEIGCPVRALQPLVQAGWVQANPSLSLEQLFDLFTKAELLRAFGRHGLSPAATKAALFQHLSAQQDQTTATQAGNASDCTVHSAKTEQHPATGAASSQVMPGAAPALPLKDWWADADDEVYELLIMPLCDRFRLMFFGNLRQDWSEFVMADLGLLQYEAVPFSSSCRALAIRQDIDDYLHLRDCAESLIAGALPQAVLARVPEQAYANRWIERRRAKLLFRVGQACERAGHWDDALAAYGASSHEEARSRKARVLERAMRHEPALWVVEAALDEPASEAEAQRLARMRPRLRRKLGLPVYACPSPQPPATLQVHAMQEEAARGVEELVRQHLHSSDAPAHYVENMLVNALFGLLCWDAIFAPLPGAFFNPFQRAPADLHDPDFAQRRRALFDTCLAQLDSDQYRRTIHDTFTAKFGRQCAFVHWPALSADLLEQALQCIPPHHLKKWFLRLLADIPGNRSGFPDLIQFWPAQRRYRMVEVKGPGDRLQDNQQRWLSFFAQHDMPVAVCFVRWTPSP